MKVIYSSVGFIANFYWFFLGIPSALGQIIPDSTLPINSRVQMQDNRILIEGGSRSGGNLFHSFERFSIPTGNEAYFNNVLTVENIFSRVTGGSISNIDGILRANGSANLYLINPAGIIFGPNASLNIGGSFIATTAEQINFDDGSFFSAKNTQTAPLLSINVPIGLQFGQSPSGNIVNQSVVTVNEQTIGLQVEPNQTIALVGRDITLEGGYLTAPQGRIELGSVDNGSLVRLASTAQGVILNYDTVENFRDIQLLQRARVNSSGTGGGDIQVRGRIVNLTEGSGIISETRGSENGGEILIEAEQLNLQGAFVSAVTSGTGNASDLTIRVSDSAQLTGRGNFRNTLLSILEGRFNENNIQNGIFTSSFGSGKAGNILLEARNLTVDNGALISASTFREGLGGNLNLFVDESINVIEAGVITGTDGIGNAGDLTITAQRLRVLNGGMIATATLGEGQGGDLTVNATESIELIGSLKIEIFEIENLGELFLGTSILFSSSLSLGNAGNVTVSAKDLLISNRGFIAANSSYEGGSSGNILLDINNLILEDKSTINSSNESRNEGQAGDIIITASERIELIGSENSFQPPSAITTYTSNSQNAGNISIITRRLIIRNGGQIQTVTYGSGAAGNIEIKATESVILNNFSSGLFTSSQEGEVENIGNAGNIRVETNELILRNGARITVSGVQSAQAGNIEIIADSLYLDNSLIRAETRAGRFGNIRLDSSNIQLRRGSDITTNSRSSDGGNISISTDTLAALENSDITANAQAGSGGRVFINAQGIFGTAYRERESDATSDITASSELGPEFSGIVNIETSGFSPNSGLVDLPDEFVDVNRLVERRCTSGTARISQFLIRGRGGLPPNPTNALTPNVGWTDSRTSALESISQSNPTDSDTAIRDSSDQIVEAQGWIINAKGEVILTSSAPNNTFSSSNCYSP